MPANLENSAVSTGVEKVSFHSNSKEGRCQKCLKCLNYRTIALISHTSKVMLKIPQAMLQKYVNWELPNVQAGFRKGRGVRDQNANIHWIIEKAREFQKNICFYCLCQSLWLCDTQQTVKNSSIDGNTRPAYLLPEKSVCRSRNNELILNWEMSTSRLYIVTCLFNLHTEYSMWNAGMVKHKLESRFPEEISITLDMQRTPLLRQKAKKN